MPVYADAGQKLFKDVFHAEENLLASDAVTVELWSGDPDAAGTLLVQERVDLDWLITNQGSPSANRVDNPENVSIGPAPGGDWSATHVRVLCGDAGVEVALWKSEIAGGTLVIPAGKYANISASLIWSILTWPWGGSGAGGTPFVRPAAVVLYHAMGGTNEIRGTATFTIEIWDHDPLHIAHGVPLASTTVARDNTEWTETSGPTSMKNTNAITVGTAPGGGWPGWAYTTMRVTGGTAFLWKTSDGAEPVAAGSDVTILAETIEFTLTVG